MEPTKKVSSGVDELIARLRAEGVEAGDAEQKRLVEEGRAEAARLVSEARAEAKRLIEEAEAQIEAERRAGEEALRLASRDTLLEVASQLRKAFAGRQRHIVAGQLGDGEFLRQLILAVAVQTREHLPEGVELKLGVSGGGAEDGEEDVALHGLIGDIAEGLLKEGVEIELAAGSQSGILIRSEGKDVVVDLREEALAELLVAHLAPRFRAMLRGVET